MADDDALDQALVSEAAGKSGLLWLGVDGHRPRPVWHEWRDGQVLVVTGDGEQQDPGLQDGTAVVVILRSKDKGGRVAEVGGTAHRLDPGSDEWLSAARTLHASRLNGPGEDETLARWRLSASVWAITVGTDVHDHVGDPSTDPGLTTTGDNAATTSSWRPFHVGRRRRVRPRGL